MITDLRPQLDRLYTQYHHRRYLGTDPICVLYRFDDPPDREVVGLISSSLAYGNVKAILGGIENVLGRMQGRPGHYLCETPPAQILRDFKNFRYRVTDGKEMACLLIGAQAMTRKYGNLNRSLCSHLQADDPTIVHALEKWVDDLTRSARRPLLHLIPNPRRGSACKRLMLYLRWMVRCDEIDPGGWSGIRPDQLVIPLDVHMHRMARRLRLTRRRQHNLKTALEITEKFRRIAPDDPLRYDFALTRPGIMRVAWSAGQ